jgi:hypothetical protein
MEFESSMKNTMPVSNLLQGNFFNVISFGLIETEIKKKSFYAK